MTAMSVEAQIGERQRPAWRTQGPSRWPEQSYGRYAPLADDPHNRCRRRIACRRCRADSAAGEIVTIWLPPTSRTDSNDNHIRHPEVPRSPLHPQRDRPPRRNSAARRRVRVRHPPLRRACRRLRRVARSERPGHGPAQVPGDPVHDIRPPQGHRPTHLEDQQVQARQHHSRSSRRPPQHRQSQRGKRLHPHPGLRPRTGSMWPRSTCQPLASPPTSDPSQLTCMPHGRGGLRPESRLR